MEKEARIAQSQTAKKERDLRRADNVGHAHALWLNGLFFWRGIPQLSKEKKAKSLKQGRLFKWKPK